MKNLSSNPPPPQQMFLPMSAPSDTKGVHKHFGSPTWTGENLQPSCFQASGNQRFHHPCESYAAIALTTHRPRNLRQKTDMRTLRQAKSKQYLHAMIPLQQKLSDLFWCDFAPESRGVATLLHFFCGKQCFFSAHDASRSFNAVRHGLWSANASFDVRNTLH